MVAFDFLRLLLTWWTRARADFELEKVENRQKLEEIKFIHFFLGGGIGVLETKVAKFAT